MKEFERPVLTPPNGEKKVLMHSCCAPCSGELIEAMVASGIELTIFSIILIFILKKNMKSGKKKILDSQIN